MTKSNKYWLIAITVIGGYLRFYNLGLNPLWHDEAFFAVMVRNGIWRQEYIPQFIAYLFNPTTEFGLRFMSALAGTLSIPAMYLVLKKYKLAGAALIAFCPLFIFWSQLARPYALAGLFMILAWKYRFALIPAILTTPISLIGMRLEKSQKLWILFIVLFTAGLYLIRPDYDRQSFTNLTIIIHSSRWYYLPAIMLILYLCDFILPYSEKNLNIDKRMLKVFGAGILIFFSFGINDIYQNKTFNEDGVMFWYRYECKFSNWKDIGQIDYATEVHPAEWYGKKDVGYFQIYSKRKIDSLLIAGDTLTVGLGQVGVNTCAQFASAYIGGYNKYIPYLYSGRVIKLKLWAEKKQVYHKIMEVL